MSANGSEAPGKDVVLEIADLRSGYGDIPVLHGISLRLHAGEAVGIVGHNGMGKTTLLKTLMGHLPARAGKIAVDGTDVTQWPAHARARLGIGYVPQEREIFSSLTVQENLKVATREGEWTSDRIYQLFPPLAQRRSNFGNQLSGGEQQMLAVGRALVSNPKMLLLDEPFEGLAPVIVDQMVDALESIRKASALAMILVEHHAEIALQFAKGAVVLDRGQVVWGGDCAELRANPDKRAALIGIEEEVRR